MENMTLVLNLQDYGRNFWAKKGGTTLEQRAWPGKQRPRGGSRGRGLAAHPLQCRWGTEDPGCQTEGPRLDFTGDGVPRRSGLRVVRARGPFIREGV